MAQQQTRMGQVKGWCSNIVEDNATVMAARGIDPELFKEQAIAAVLQNPDIVECTNQSLARAIRASCLTGLPADGRNAAMIGFRNRNGDREASFIIMREGLQRLVHDALGVTIRSGHVYEEDVFEFSNIVNGGPEQNWVKHMPSLRRGPKSQLIGAYCVIQVPDEKEPRIWVVGEQEIIKARAASRAKGGPWEVWRGMMAEKFVIKRACNSISYLIPGDRRGIIEDALTSDDDAVDQQEVAESVKVAEQAQNEPQKIAHQPTQAVVVEVKPEPEKVAADPKPKPAAAKKRRPAEPEETENPAPTPAPQQGGDSDWLSDGSTDI